MRKSVLKLVLIVIVLTAAFTASAQADYTGGTTGDDVCRTADWHDITASRVIYDDLEHGRHCRVRGRCLTCVEYRLCAPGSGNNNYCCYRWGWVGCWTYYHGILC